MIFLKECTEIYVGAREITDSEYDTINPLLNSENTFILQTIDQALLLFLYNSKCMYM